MKTPGSGIVQPISLRSLRYSGAQVEFDDRPGDRSRDRVATAASEDLQQSREAVATHDVDHHIHWLTMQSGHEIRIAGQHTGRTETPHFGGLLQRGERNDMAAPPPGELDRCRSDTA